MYTHYSASSFAGQAVLAKKRSLAAPPSWEGEPPPSAATAATSSQYDDFDESLFGDPPDDNMKGKGLVNESLFGDPPLSVDEQLEQFVGEQFVLGAVQAARVDAAQRPLDDAFVLGVVQAACDAGRDDAARDDACEDDLLADLRAAPCEDPEEEEVVFIVLFSFVLVLVLVLEFIQSLPRILSGD